MSAREKAIEGICERTGKTREQAEAFLDLLGSGLARRGWADGAPLSREQISDRFDTFMGDAKPWHCSHSPRCADSVCSDNPAIQRWTRGER